MISNASATFSFSNDQFLFAIISFVNNCDPMPTHMTPALNQALRFCSVGSTPPVGMICNPGTTGIIADTNPGPNTEPGNTLMTAEIGRASCRERVWVAGVV